MNQYVNTEKLREHNDRLAEHAAKHHDAFARDRRRCADGVHTFISNDLLRWCVRCDYSERITA